MTSAGVSAAELQEILAPRHDLVIEAEPVVNGTTYTFHKEIGPFSVYQRRVQVTTTINSTLVKQDVDWKIRVPYFAWLFWLPVRHRINRILPPKRRAFWMPPAVLDDRASRTIGALALLSLITGYLGTLFTQTVTYMGDEFHFGTDRQTTILALLRFDVITLLLVCGLANRFGRSKLIWQGLLLSCVATAFTALMPTMALVVISQIPTRGLLGAIGVTIAVLLAEEVPAGARAFAIGMVGMAAGIGPGLCVSLLHIADISTGAWRWLFAISLLFIPAVWRAKGNLAESERFIQHKTEKRSLGHHKRSLILLCATGFLGAAFLTPASQLQNEFLRYARGYSGAGVSWFAILTGAPGGIGVVIGGLVADRWGRRGIGTVGIVIGTVFVAISYNTTGALMWATALVGTFGAAMTLPALAVYGPELFPTSLRTRANGVLTTAARVGSVVGLVVAGVLTTKRGEVGHAMIVVSAFTLAMAGIVWWCYPETAQISLEELNPSDKAVQAEG